MVLKSFFQKNFYIFLSLSTVFLNFLCNNTGKYFSGLSLLLVIIAFLIVFIFSNYCLKLILKNKAVSQYIISLFIYLFFTYSYFCDDVYTKFFLVRSIPFSCVWVVVVFGVLSLFYKFFNSHVVVVFSKNLIVFTFMAQLGLYLYGMYFYHAQFKQEFPGVKSFGSFVQKPNVYFFLIDGYPNTKVLKEVTGFDNAEFETALKERGFLFPEESFSNYQFTLASVSSQLMAEYHKMDKNIASETFSRMIAGNNNVVKTFKENGYTYIFAPSGVYSELESNGLEDLSIQMDLYKTFLDMTFLRKYTDVFSGRYLEPQDLESMIEDHKNNRIFVYAHFMQVHDVVNTISGQILSGRITMIQDRNSKKMLLDSVYSMNSKILKLIDFVLKNDNNCIIIVNSDHGIPTGKNALSTQEEAKESWSSYGVNMSRDQQRRRFKNFIAIYNGVSSGPEFSFQKEISNVNIFRGIFKFLGIQNINLLENRAFLFNYNEKEKAYYLEKEVTENVR